MSVYGLDQTELKRSEQVEGGCMCLSQFCTIDYSQSLLSQLFCAAKKNSLQYCAPRFPLKHDRQRLELCLK